MNPINFRGVERIIIALGGIFFGYLGYRLFLKGLTAGDGNLQLESETMKLIFTGTGPGLFFMVFGALVLVVCIIKGGVTKKETINEGLTMGKGMGETMASATTEMADSARQSQTDLTEARVTEGKPYEPSPPEPMRTITNEIQVLKDVPMAGMKKDL